MKVHVLRLSNDRRAATAQTARDHREAQLRSRLRTGGGGDGSGGDGGGGAGSCAAANGSGGGRYDDNDCDEEAAAELARARSAKEAQRELVLRRVLHASPRARPHTVLGLPSRASKEELMQAIRLALRLLHPDRAMNLPLRGTPEGKRLEAAFKRVNNLNDDL